MQLTEKQIEQFIQIVKLAYPKRADLKMMLKIKLGISLNDFVSEKIGMSETALELHEQLESDGRLSNFLQAMKEDKPSNKQVQDFVASLEAPPAQKAGVGSGKAQPQVYISYSWKPDSNEIAEALEAQLQTCGLELIRDKINGVGYMESISQFMDEIGQGKYVLLVLGYDYLRSPNCMYELCRIAEASDGDFEKIKERVFIVTLNNIKIYDALDRVALIQYWEQKYHELNGAIKQGGDLLLYESLTADLKLYEAILSNLRSGIASKISDLNTLSTKIHRETGYREVIERLAAAMRKDGYEVDLSGIAKS